MRRSNQAGDLENDNIENGSCMESARIYLRQTFPLLDGLCGGVIDHPSPGESNDTFQSKLISTQLNIHNSRPNSIKLRAQF